jgi:hypothetical protein
VLCFEVHTASTAASGVGAGGRRGGGGGTDVHAFVCSQCSRDPQRLGWIVAARSAQLQRQREALRQVCTSCCSAAGLGVPRSAALAEKCASIDCPVYFERVVLLGRHNLGLLRGRRRERRRLSRGARGAAARFRGPRPADGGAGDGAGAGDDAGESAAAIAFGW